MYKEVNKLRQGLRSPWWQVLNSGLIILFLTTLISTCQKTKELEIAVRNSNTLRVSNQNQVKIINQSITKVEKEIANIREAIHEYYNEIVTEVFRQQDRGNKMKLIPIPGQEGQSALFFMLNKIPEPNSIRIITHRGTSVPLTTLRISRNIVMVQISGLSELFPGSSDYVEVSYTPNFFAIRPLFTLEDIEMIKVTEGRFDFKLKENRR
jgi:hypothetical protein